MFGRKINMFEKLLLPVGVGLTLLGFYLIYLADRTGDATAWSRLTAVFTWMVLLFLVIITATTEDMKEELSLIQKEHVTEIKVLREVVHDQLRETKMMRKEFNKENK